MVERFDVLPDRRFEVLPFGEVEILPPRIPQDVAEKVDSPTAFLREVDIVDRPVHLTLGSGICFEPHRQRLDRLHAEMDKYDVRYPSYIDESLDYFFSQNAWDPVGKTQLISQPEVN